MPGILTGATARKAQPNPLRYECLHKKCLISWYFKLFCGECFASGDVFTNLNGNSFRILFLFWRYLKAPFVGMFLKEV